MMQDNRIEVCRITHPSGAYIEVCNYGATWLSAVMPDRQGSLGEVLLGYNDVEAMMSDPNYAGRTIGRYANRIRKGAFSLFGKAYRLEINDGVNSNHSGPSGMSFRLFDIQSRTKQSVTFRYFSPDGEGGFPGNVDVFVTYTLTEDLKVCIDYRATTDATTILNLTNHAYFNLNGGGDIYSHILHIPSKQMLETDYEFLPTGKVLDVADTPFDFSQGKQVGKDINPDLEQFRWNRGYNHCYMFEKQDAGKECRLMAELRSQETGRSVSLSSTYPSVQIYSGGFLGSSCPTRFGRYALPADGIALEAQFAPNTPNMPQFPQCTLTPDREYSHRIVYRFGTFE